MAVMERIMRPEWVVPTIRVLAKRDWTSRALTRMLAPFNLLDPRRYSDPYPLYEELRAAGPVYNHRRANTWMVTGHAEAEEVLRGSVSVDRSEVMAKLTPYKNVETSTIDLMTSMMLMLDPPDHTRLRQLVSRAFTPRRIAELEPDLRRIADELLDDVSADHERRPGDAVDVMAPFAVKLPIYLIGRLLGLDEAIWPRLKDLSDLVAQFIDPLTSFDPDEVHRAVAELSRLFDDEIDRRRTEPTDDLTTAMVEAEADGDRLDRTELKAMMMLLMVAGHETTTGLIGNALLAFDEGPAGHAARQRWLDDPTLADGAVEELLRYDSPVQVTDRLAADDIHIDGQVIPAGAPVAIMLGAANRDPRIHDRPAELIIDRADPRPMSFGHGPHYCVGAALARLEAKVAIDAFLGRFPDYSIDRAQLTWKRSIILRGPTLLPVRLTA